MDFIEIGKIGLGNGLSPELACKGFDRLVYVPASWGYEGMVTTKYGIRLDPQIRVILNKLSVPYSTRRLGNVGLDASERVVLRNSTRKPTTYLDILCLTKEVGMELGTHKAFLDTWSRDTNPTPNLLIGDLYEITRAGEIRVYKRVVEIKDGRFLGWNGGIINPVTLKREQVESLLNGNGRRVLTYYDKGIPKHTSSTTDTGPVLQIKRSSGVKIMIRRYSKSLGNVIDLTQRIEDPLPEVGLFCATKISISTAEGIHSDAIKDSH